MPSSLVKYPNRNAATRAPTRRGAITRNWLKAVFARQRGNLVENTLDACCRPRPEART